MKRPPRGNTKKATKSNKESSISGGERHFTRQLPSDYIPGDNDVICGRGNECMNHVGNLNFRNTIENMLDRYSKATSKNDKSTIIVEIVNQVRQNSPLGGFIKKDLLTGCYFEVGDFAAREKTSQAFRDALSDRYKSSKATRKRKRTEERIAHGTVSTTAKLPETPSFSGTNEDTQWPRLNTPLSEPFQQKLSASLLQQSSEKGVQPNTFDTKDTSYPTSFSIQDRAFQDPQGMRLSEQEAAFQFRFCHDLNTLIDEEVRQQRSMNISTYTAASDYQARTYPGYMDPRERILSPHLQILQQPPSYENLQLLSAAGLNAPPHLSMQNPSTATAAASAAHDRLLDNESMLESLRRYPEFSTLDLSSLEPTPIAERDSKPPSPEDVKPPAKR